MTLLRSTTLVASLALAFGATVHAAPPTTGLDLSGMDKQVRPQDDLWEAMNGTWKKNTPIPEDKSRIGGFIQLDDLSNERVKSVIDSLATQKQPAGSVNQKIGDYFNAYLDTAAIDKAGLAPLSNMLKEVDALKTTKDVVALMGRWQSLSTTPLRLGVEQDLKNPEIYVPVVYQGGLGMPQRDFYLKDTEAFKKDRAAYVVYLGKLFQLSGDAPAAAKQHADAVMALEMKIAQAQWSAVDDRDSEKTYNPMSVKALAGKAPGVDWNLLVRTGRMPVPGELVVGEPSFMVDFAKILAATPVATWKQYFRVHLIDGEARLLPQPYRDASFEFRGHVLAGQGAERPRWQLAIRNLNGAMGEAVGQAYVERYFPAAAKARMDELVHNLLAAYSQSIDGLTWMSPTTKAAAHEKLSKYTTKIGYPEKWRDYATLEVRAGDPVGNEMRANEFEYQRQAVRVGKPVDRKEWGMTPQTVNAYYDPSMNEIVFPAAILQPPFFDMTADDAANYGAIGAVIGHEISHGFDDQGSKFDGDGKLRSWWTAEDRKAFDGITARLVSQYNGYEPIKGNKLNGQLTLGENIADLSGLQIAYKAYKISLKGQPAPVIDGLTGDQRFFLGFAQAWREARREQLQLEFLTRDPHSPPEFRANGAAINSDAFHEAFGTKPGDGMWKAPADRIRLW